MSVLASRCLVALLVMLACHKSGAVKPFYRHFDEYLNSLAHMRPDSRTDAEEEVRDHGFKRRNVVTRGTSGATRRNMSCCMLGEMAGDKGFHCFADYYAARIVMRNRNRAHNRKMGFYGRYRTPNYGHHLMKTFERCVQRQANIFHKCCHLATLERREKVKFRLRNGTGRHANHTIIANNATIDANVTNSSGEDELHHLI